MVNNILHDDIYRKIQIHIPKANNYSSGKKSFKNSKNLFNQFKYTFLLKSF